VTPTTGGALRSVTRVQRSLRPKNLRRRAWEDGVLGGDVRWLLVGGVAWLGWLLAWAWRREPEVAFRTKLKPGESVVISASAPEARRGRPS
jgi:hypothetical protein